MGLPKENARLKKVIEYYFEGNESAFSKAIGVSQPRINRLFSEDKRSGEFPLISFEILQATINKYVEINPEWLINGRGEMFKNKYAVNVVSEPETKYAVKSMRKLKTDHEKESQRIPFYEITATAGVIDIISDQYRRSHIPIDYISIPNMPRCDGALPITGDSMYPLLKSGDIVLFKEINDKNNIVWGEMYLAAIRHNGDELFFAKYIQKADRDGYARFVSENRHHQPVEYPIDSIAALALIKATIRFQSQF